MAQNWVDSGLSGGEDDTFLVATDESGVDAQQPCQEFVSSPSLWGSGSSSPKENDASSKSSGSSSPSSTNTSSSMTSVADMATSGLWVFGYGSLCWNQGFDFSESTTGYVKGYSRRFWQGNTTHRGTVEKPGRVATLVQDCEGIVWGQAFQVRGDAALPYLNNRECDLGGYRTTLATFHPRESSSPPFPVMLYVATPNNRHWLGESPLTDIADQIVDSQGNSGHNVEYLLKLAEFMRETIPEAADDHLFRLEELVREEVCKRKLCLQTLMRRVPIDAVQEGRDPIPVAAALEPQASSQFSKRVPSKKLRCVNI